VVNINNSETDLTSASQISVLYCNCKPYCSPRVIFYSA